jgi:hypothetical protein
METLQAKMKNHNTSIDSFSSHGLALSTFGFSFNATSTSSSDDRLIDSRASYHMAKDKSIFSLLMNVTPRKYLLVMINLLVL